MFLKSLDVKGYKKFQKPFNIPFSNGLNVLVGENGVGKTGIVNSIRMLLQEDEFGRNPINDSDFYKSFDNKATVSEICITGVFDNETEEE